MKCVVVFVFVLLVGKYGSYASTEWKFVTTNNDGMRLPVAVALNRRSMLTIPDKVKNGKRCIKRTINQHDFQQGLVAMKDPEKRLCLIKPLGKRETYDSVKQLLDSGNEIIQTNEHWIVPRRSLPKEKLEKEIGSMLADFCSDAHVYKLKRSLSTPKKGACGWACFGCSIDVQKEGESTYLKLEDPLIGTVVRKINGKTYLQSKKFLSKYNVK